MSGYFSGDKVSFSEAFPSIECIEMEVFTSEGVTMFDRKSTLHYSTESPPPAAIRCPRGGCTGSGFDVQRLLMHMVAKKETEKEVAEMCNGQEKLGRHRRGCIGSFAVKVKITYKKDNIQV